MRAIIFAHVAVIGIFSGAFAQEALTEDPVAARLAESGGRYRETIDKAKKDLLAALEKKTQQIKSNKRLKVQDQIEQLNRFKAESERFETGNRLPESPVMRIAVSDYRSAIQKARKKYQAEVDRAATAYRDRGELDLAERALQEGAKILDTPSQQDEAANDWIVLFNGKDLTEWRKEGGADWVVVDGLLRGSGPQGKLVTKRDDFTDFHLRVRAMINDGGNSGIFFRYQVGGPLRTYEAQINSTDRKDATRTGSLWLADGRSAAVAVPIERAVVPAGKWFWLEVVASENRLSIAVDDKELVNHVDSERHYSRGAIAIQQHHPGSIVMIESVEIKGLPTPR
jgi:hypothetical protein